MTDNKKEHYKVYPEFQCNTKDYMSESTEDNKILKFRYYIDFYNDLPKVEIVDNAGIEHEFNSTNPIFQPWEIIDKLRMRSAVQVLRPAVNVIFPDSIHSSNIYKPTIDIKQLNREDCATQIQSEVDILGNSCNRVYLLGPHKEPIKEYYCKRFGSRGQVLDADESRLIGLNNPKVIEKILRDELKDGYELHVEILTWTHDIVYKKMSDVKSEFISTEQELDDYELSHYFIRTSVTYDDDMWKDYQQ